MIAETDGRPIALGTRAVALATRAAERPRAAAVALGAAIPLVALGAANGGYFPSAWNWATLGFAALAAVALALGGRRTPTAPSIVFVVALALFACWTGASVAWSSDVTHTILEAERSLVYVAGAGALVLLARRRSAVTLLVAVWCSSLAVASWGLATRLVPRIGGPIDAVSGRRLSVPIGYWNGLGLLAAMGIVLAVGCTVVVRRKAAIHLAAASTPVFVATLYLTFSRGAWAVLLVGLVLLAFVSRSRGKMLLATLALVPSALVVAVASRESALSDITAPISDRSSEGAAVAVAVAIAVVCAVAVRALSAALDARIVLPPVPRGARQVGCAVAAAAAVAFVLSAYGPPPTIATNAWRQFTKTQPAVGADLNARLFSLSGTGRIDQWRVAAAEIRSNPLLGGGAGSFEQHWNVDRPGPIKVRNVHNLYLEVLATVGPVGLALLLLALLTPFAAIPRARRDPATALALAVYAMWVVHAGIDWDWQIPALTLAALFCAIAAMARGESSPVGTDGWRTSAVAGTAIVTVAAAAFVGLVGNMALAQSSSAADSGRWAAAAKDARRAAVWQPWSSQPWQQLGEAQLAQGNLAAARASFGRAIAKDAGNWSLWFDLARASGGDAQRRALARATRLNPLGPEIRELRAELASDEPLSLVPAGASR